MIRRRWPQRNSSRTSTRWAAASTTRGRLEVGGCDTVELAREFGTPCYVVAEDDIRARARAFVEAFARPHRRLRGRLRVEGVAVHRGLPAALGGGASVRRRLRRRARTWRCAAGFDPAADPHARQQQVRGRAALRARAGVGEVIVDNQRDIDLLEELVPALRDGRRSGCVLRDHARRQPATRTLRSRPGRPTRSSASGSRTRPRGDRAGAASPRLELLGLHVHIGSQIFELEPFRGARSRRSRRSATSRSYNLGGGLGIAYGAHDEPPSIEDYVDAKVGAVERADRARAAGPRRARARAGRQRRRHALRGRRRQAQRRRPTSPSTAACPTTCGRCSTARATRRTIADRAGRRRPRCHIAGKHCESGDILVRDAELADPRPGDVLVMPATGAYGHAMANNYNGVPRPPVVFCRTATPAWSSAARPTRTCSRAMSDASPSTSACSAAAPSARAFAELLDERARRGRAAHRPAPADRRRADAQRAATSSEILAGSDLVVELIGGIDPARELRRSRALRAGTPVVTANKQLVAAARRGAVRAARASTACRAALRGRRRRRRPGDPRARRSRSPARTIERVHGIVNGTTNFILTRDGRDRRLLRGGARRGPGRSATPRPTRPRTSTAPTPRRRWRSSRGSPSAPRSTSTTSPTRASSTSPPTTSRTPSELGLVAEAARHRRARRRRDPRPRAPRVPLRRPPAGDRRAARSTP